MSMEMRKGGEQRIRGPGLAVFVKSANGVPFVEGLRMADEKGLVIVSNKRLGRTLVGSEELQKIRKVFPCWSGTVTAYRRPGEELGTTVEYVDLDTKERWVFPVPKEYQKKKDAILVAEHPDYKVEVDGKNIIVHATAVDLVTNFVASSYGCCIYPVDTKHGIPIELMLPDGFGRPKYLWREKGCRVGPVARDFDGLSDWYDGMRHVVDLSGRPSNRLGVVVEAPRGVRRKLRHPNSQWQEKATN